MAQTYNQKRNVYSIDQILGHGKDEGEMFIFSFSSRIPLAIARGREDRTETETRFLGFVDRRSERFSFSSGSFDPNVNLKRD